MCACVAKAARWLTLEMALLRVGFGAVLLEPNNRFIVEYQVGRCGRGGLTGDKVAVEVVVVVFGVMPGPLSLSIMCHVNAEREAYYKD